MGDISERPDIINSWEIENYTNGIQKSTITELGSLGWLEKHDRFKQLNIQAVIQAITNREETVKDNLVSFGKLPILVHELVLIELWREAILPEILKEKPKNCFAIYPILYHESTVINLLETVMYHSAAIESLEDTSLDLIDYCLRTLNYFATWDNDDEDEDDNDKPSQAGAGDQQKVAGQQELPPPDLDLKKQSETLLIGISIKCISTLRYLIENLDKLGNGILSRLVVSTDTPLLLTELIVRKPWRKEYWRQGKVMDFDPVDNIWKVIDPSTRHLFSAIDVQAWLCLYLLLKNNKVLGCYELYDSRKTQLLKLQPYLNEATLDQLPILTEFHVFLSQMAVMQGQSGPSTSPLLLEVVPPIREALATHLKENKRTILRECKHELVHCSLDNMFHKAKKLASAYDIDQFEPALPITHKCTKCGNDAEKKCGKCKLAWYCGKECQQADWNSHKANCSG